MYLYTNVYIHTYIHIYIHTYTVFVTSSIGALLCITLYFVSSQPFNAISEANIVC